MRIAPIVLAVAVAAVTLWRWPRLHWLLRGLGAAVCGGFVLYGAEVIHLPQLEDVIASLGSTLRGYTYALVAVMAFLETGAFVGLLVPGETVVLVGGVVAGQGQIDLGVLLGLTWLCAFAGDVTGYLLGRRLGRRFLLAHGPRVHITESRLLQVEAFLGRYGPATILLGRFAGMVRPVAPFLAGASKYPPARFVGLAVFGTGLWSAAFVLLGYLFWQSLDEAIAIAKRGSLALGVTVALVIALLACYRYLRDRARRARSPESQRRSSSAQTNRTRGDGVFPDVRPGCERGLSASAAGLRVRPEESS
ncbi:MAG: DedA family protein [Solirubrobacterales bacterium]|nr:DedA family protein [Solirubrobacterales bacterium]